MRYLAIAPVKSGIRRRRCRIPGTPRPMSTTPPRAETSRRDLCLRGDVPAVRVRIPPACVRMPAPAAAGRTGASDCAPASARAQDRRPAKGRDRLKAALRTMFMRSRALAKSGLIGRAPPILELEPGDLLSSKRGSRLRQLSHSYNVAVYLLPLGPRSRSRCCRERLSSSAGKSPSAVR